MKKLPFCAFPLVFCLSSFIAVAQNMVVSEGLSIRNDYGYELIGRLRDRILLFRDKYDEFEVQAFDNQMQLSWTRDLEDLEKRGVQILSVVGSKNDFSVIHKLRRRSRNVLRVHKYDPGANMIDSTTVKDYGERVFNPPVLDIVRSEDRNCFVVFNTAERNKLEATCFRLDKMQVLWDKTVAVDDDFYEMGELQAMALSNNGDFFLIKEINNRRSKMEGHEFQVFRINEGPDSFTRVPLGDFLTNDMRFVYDNQNRRLVAAGLFADKNRDRANGVFFLSVIPGNDASQQLHYEPFDDKFLSVLRRKDVSDDKGLEDAEVKQLILRHDGGVVLVAERQREIQRGASAGRGFWRDGMRMIVDYYYDDLFIIALNPDGTTHWKTALHKKQYSQDDEGTFSSFFLHRNADKLRFMFNDEIKYENTCSEYVISPAGDFDRNSLANTVGQNLRLRFRDALQISASECLIPSEFRNKLKIVLLRFQ